MKNLNKKAVSILEYILLFIIVIGAFIIMKGYIQRGINGNWGNTGQSFAFGRQYDSPKTVDCSFDQQSNQWYDSNCFQYYSSSYCPSGACNTNNRCRNGSPCGCNGSATCEESIINANKCSASTCNQLNNGGTL